MSKEVVPVFVPAPVKTVMDNELSDKIPQYQFEKENEYGVFTMGDKNPALHSPSAPYDCYFYATKDTLSDPEVYRNFIKNAEARFRRSKEYKVFEMFRKTGLW